MWLPVAALRSPVVRDPVWMCSLNAADKAMNMKCRNRLHRLMGLVRPRTELQTMVKNRRSLRRPKKDMSRMVCPMKRVCRHKTQHWTSLRHREMGTSPMWRTSPPQHRLTVVTALMKPTHNRRVHGGMILGQLKMVTSLAAAMAVPAGRRPQALAVASATTVMAMALVVERRDPQ